MGLNIKFLKEISLYSVNNLLNSGLNFLMIPLYTKFLAPEQFGILSLLNTGMVFMMPFILLGSNGYVQIRYNQDKEDFGNIFSNTCYLVFISFLIFQILGLGAFLGAGKTFQIPSVLFIAVPFLAFLQAVYQIMLAFFQVTGRPVLYSKVNISYTIVNISTTVFLLSVVGLQWEARMFSYLFTLGIAMVFFLIFFKREKLLFLPLGKSYLKGGIAFGLPLIPHAIGALLLDFAAKIIITKELGASANGIYSLASQIAFIVVVVDMSLSLAYTPYVYKKMAEDTPEAKRYIVKISYYFIIAIIASYVILIAGRGLLFRFFISRKYESASSLVPVIAAGSVFSAIYKVFVAPIFYYKKTRYLAYLGVFNMVFGSIVTYVLIKTSGLMGAALGACLSFFLFTLIVAFISVKIYKLPWFSMVPEKQ